MKKILLSVVLLAWAVPALAVPLLPTNLDTVLTGPLIAAVARPITSAAPPPATMGTLDSEVYFDGSLYTYINTVTPSLDDVSHFNTAFSVAGFTGTAGWSFSDALGAGGTGTGFDFLLVQNDFSSRLHWLALNQPLGNDWDANEPISFFFQSRLGPVLGDYNLLNGEAGTAVNAFAPGPAAIPEPMSLLLVGSGMALAARMIRGRRKPTALPVA